MSPISILILILVLDLAEVHLKVDIVDAHHFSSIDVDDLLVKQVAFQQEQALRAIDYRPRSRRRGRANPAIDGRNRRKRQNAIA